MKRRPFLALLALKFLASSVLHATPPAIDVRTTGATGDGVTLDTTAIQRAIDQANVAGGGVVHLPAGTYRSGTIELRAGVTLDLAAGATLLGSDRLADYRRGHWPALLIAKKQQNIAVTGQGTLDGNSQALEKVFARIRASGNGLEFFPQAAPGQALDIIGPTGVPTLVDPYKLQAQGKLIAYLYGKMTRPYEFVRPQVIEFWDCHGVTVRGITLKNSACWVQTYRDCEDLLIEKIKVRSTGYWNNDGIDLVDCRRVQVLDCDIDSSDDALCLKSDPRGAGCADITIVRCVLASRASALKFGTASHHGFKRVHASDLVVRDTYRSVVAIQSVDGAAIEDIKVEHVRATNTGNAFFIRLGHRTQSKPPGSIRGVVLRDIDVEVPALGAEPHFEGGKHYNLIPGSIVGLPGHPVEEVVLEDVRVRYGGGSRRDRAEVKLEALDSIPENAGDYPEFSMWGELPAWATYLRHTKNVTLRRVEFSLKSPDFRSAVVADDSAGLMISASTISAGGGGPVVVFKDSPRAQLTESNLPSHATEPLRVIASRP